MCVPHFTSASQHFASVQTGGVPSQTKFVLAALSWNPFEHVKDGHLTSASQQIVLVQSIALVPQDSIALLALSWNPPGQVNVSQ